MKYPFCQSGNPPNEKMAAKCPFCESDDPTRSNFCGNCGTEISPEPSKEKEQLYIPIPERHCMTVNVICLIGAIMASLSLFLPWAIMQDEASDVETDIGAYDFDDSVPEISSLPDGFRISVTIFLAGTALAFLSPLGGFPLFTGSVGFMLTAVTGRFETSELMTSLGAWLAVLSSVIVLCSFAYPFGLVYPIDPRHSSRKTHGLVSRLLTWSVFRVGETSWECSKCGAEFYVGHAFCGFCGEPLKQKAKAPTPKQRGV